MLPRIVHKVTRFGIGGEMFFWWGSSGIKLAGRRKSRVVLQQRHV